MVNVLRLGMYVNTKQMVHGCHPSMKPYNMNMQWMDSL